MEAKVEKYLRGNDTILITLDEDYGYLLVPSGFVNPKEYYLICYNPYRDITKHHGNLYTTEQIEKLLDIKIKL